MDAKDLFAYTVRLRRRLLEALQAAPPDLLEREMGTNHRSILQTLIHVMAVEASWVREDLLGERPLSWDEFRDRYLGGAPSLQTVTSGWQEITAGTVRYLRDNPDLQRRVEIAGSGGRGRSVTVEQILYHLVGEELIHCGEVLAMTRQLDIDLPSYFLMEVMEAGDRPWEGWIAEPTTPPA